MRKILTTILILFSVVSFAQPGNPVINVSQIFADSLIVSWTKPATADSFVLERSTDAGFTSPTQVSATGQQIYYEDGLTPNTEYWYRVKAINKASGLGSGWTAIKTKTFWTPSATSQGGNRIAVQADVDNATLNPDGFIEVGDYLYVGWRGNGRYCAAGDCFQWGTTIYLTAPPTLAAGKKICIIGNTGYDYIEIDCKNNVGTAENPIIITNIGGQSRTGQLRLTNAKHYLITGKYDPVKKTGSSQYLGFDNTDWANLHGSFGFYFQSTWGQRGVSIIGLSGDCEDVRFEYIQAGEGGFASIVAKNDSYHPSDMSISSTGSLDTYGNTTQSFGNGLAAWSSERVRITLNTVTSMRVDSITFVGTGTTTGTYTFQAESYDGSNHATNNGTTVTLTTTSTSDKAYIDIPLNNLPPGTYDYSIIRSTTTTTSVSNQVASTPINGLTVRDCYFPDGGSEGIYLGSTQAAPTMAAKNIVIERCVYARNGGNSVQIGQLKQDGKFRHNIFISGGFEWNNSFQKFQDQQLQMSIRQNKFDFDSNLVLGANSLFNYSINTLPYDTTYTTDTANFRNNAFLNVKSWSAGFTNSNTNGKGAMNFTGNYWARFGTLHDYNTLFTVTPTNYVVKFDNLGGGQLDGIAKDNVYDATTLSGGSFAIVGGTATINQSGNVRQSTVPYPVFNNFMDKDSTFDFSAMEQWTDSLEPQWNSTNKSGTKFDSAATAQGTTVALAVILRTYDLGDIVRHDGLFYKSLIANNQGHQPTGYTDSYWELIVFSNGSVMPIDDVRQVEGSFYQTKGMGLAETVTAGTPAQLPSFKIKKGSRIIFKPRS